MTHPSRRSLLRALGGAGLLAGLAPRLARAGGSPRKLVFVANLGGWDPTRVFAPAFTNPDVDMEAQAEEARAGELAYVAHPDRPAVSAFLERWYARTAFLNGVLVPAISHELCRTFSLTGGSSGLTADWGSRVAAAEADRYVLPHLVVAGPAFAGDHGSFVARAGLGGQLDGLLSGRLLDRADQRVESPVGEDAALIEAFVRARAGARHAAASAGLDAALAGAVDLGLERAAALRALSETVSFRSGDELTEQVALAVEMLSRGVSRVVSLAWPADGGVGAWDTHVDNDEGQTLLFEELFVGLDTLVAALAAAPGESAPSLLDETTVVVWSEMGRTPQLNGTAGKDHWPYTSCMLVGAGVAGGRAYGGFDDNFSGQPVDPASGEVDEGGVPLSTEVVGATILALAGLDPGEELPGVPVLEGVLS